MSSSEPARSAWIIPSAILAVGLVLTGWILGAEIRTARSADRFVTVRGLAERNVKSDLALWRLTFSDAGGDLKTTFAKSEQDQSVVLAFLKSQGIPGGDVTLGQPNVLDNAASPNSQQSRRFVVQCAITVHSTNVDQVAAAVQHTGALVARGVVLGAGQGGGVSYLFTGLNRIKPSMITAATQNARVAAERFAADSQSRVGSIRQASQGLFQISDADAPSNGIGYYDSSSSIMKDVRVVTEVEYYLVP